MLLNVTLHGVVTHLYVAGEC